MPSQHPPVRSARIKYTIDTDQYASAVNYTIRPAAPEHLRHLPGIEDAAGEAFPVEDLPEPLRSLGISPQDFEKAQAGELLWVVVDESETPIAFLLARIVDGNFHIAEFDVHPEHGRRGVGSRLLEFALAMAGQRAFPAATLTTFEHLPWNAPYYSRHGFERLPTDQVGDELAEIVKKEAALGLQRRIAMKANLQPDKMFEAAGIVLFAAQPRDRKVRKRRSGWEDRARG